MLTVTTMAQSTMLQSLMAAPLVPVVVAFFLPFYR